MTYLFKLRNMETALTILSYLPTSKEQKFAFFRQVKEEILSGTHDPLEVAKNLAIIEDVISSLRKDEDIDYLVLREFEKYGEKVLEKYGVKFQQMEAGVRYDYESCGDPVWLDLDRQIKELTEKKKEREKFLQNIPVNTTGVVDPETGVFIQRPSRTSKTKIAVKI